MTQLTMASLLGRLLILSAMTTPGFSLTCNNCLTTTSQSCSQPTVTCPSGNVCIAAYSVLTAGSSTSQYSISCGSPNVCNQTGTWTYNGGTIRTGTSCCNTDNCTPTLPTLPTQNSTQNGVTCSTCSSGSSTYCLTSQTLACTGAETMCGRLSTEITGIRQESTVIRGCTTQSFCDILGTQTSSYSGLNVQLNTYCSNGAIGLHSGFFSSVFALVLTKLFF